MTAPREATPWHDEPAPRWAACTTSSKLAGEHMGLRPVVPGFDSRLYGCMLCAPTGRCWYCGVQLVSVTIPAPREVTECTCPPMWSRSLGRHHPKCPMREVSAKVVPDLVSDEWLDEARADSEAGCMFAPDAVRRLIGHIDVLTTAINARGKAGAQ